MVSEHLRERITEVPQEVKFMGKTPRKIYEEIAETLKVIEVGKGIKFTDEEMTKNFGKIPTQNIPNGLAKFKIGKVSVRRDNATGLNYVFLRSRN